MNKLYKSLIFLAISLFFLGVLGLVMMYARDSRDAPFPDPAEVVYVYKHKCELIEQAKSGDVDALEKLNFAYGFTGDEDLKVEVHEIRTVWDRFHICF